MLGEFFGTFLVLGAYLLWKDNVIRWGLVAVGPANDVRAWSRIRRAIA